MKNIHVLPTDKPSRLFINPLWEKQLRFVKDELIEKKHKERLPQNIYITNSEEIKEGGWCLDKFNQIWKLENNKLIAFDSKGIKRFSTDNISGHDCKKITLTTNSDLIKDGVQSIDDDFLEWFIRNSSCEEVVIEKYCRNGLCDGSGMCRYLCECIGKRITIPREELLVVETTLEDFRVKPKEEPKQDFYKIGDFNKNCDDSCKYHCTKGNTQLAECLKEPKLEVEWVSNNPQCKQTESCYNSLSKKCICPKEEPKQDKIMERFFANAKQETLKEAAEKELSFIANSCRNFDFDLGFKTGILIGVKWQLEQDKKLCIKEEVNKLLDKLLENNMCSHAGDELIEQFKKK